MTFFTLPYPLQFLFIAWVFFLYIPLLVILFLKIYRGLPLRVCLTDLSCLLLLMLDSFSLVSPSAARLRGYSGMPCQDFFTSLPIIIHLSLVVFVSIWCIRSFREINRQSKNTLTINSVREALDNLPSGLCLASDDGIPVFTNRQMYFLAGQLTGEFLSNLQVFWECLLHLGETIGGDQRQVIFFLPDGQAWRFMREELIAEEEVFIQVVAMDISRLWAVSKELEKENKQLIRQRKRLRELLENIAEIRQREDVLSSKIRLHDRLGKVILTTRHHLQDKMSRETCQVLLTMWKELIEGLGADALAGDGKVEALNELINVASVLGCEISFVGNFPERDGIFLAAVREALANAVRHAKASLLTVCTEEREHDTQLVIFDNGIKHAGKIVEGSGLSSLRERVELIGGTMVVDSTSGVRLKITVPRKGLVRG